jgi:hypothetical protein
VKLTILPPFGAEVKNEWSYASTPPHVLILHKYKPQVVTNVSEKHVASIFRVMKMDTGGYHLPSSSAWDGSA